MCYPESTIPAKFDQQSTEQIFVATVVAYAISTTLTKFSILLFYNRIFPSTRLVRISWVVAGIVTAYNLTLIVITGLQCIPLSTLWTKRPGFCVNIFPAFTTLA